MVQLALFAIPRGYTEEGEADSANAAPHIDSDDSSLDDDPPDHVTAEQFRKCEDMLDILIELAGDPYTDILQFQFPAFSLRLPNLGVVRASPIDFATISQKLQSGTYPKVDNFLFDLILCIALCHLHHDSGILYKVETEFRRWCDDLRAHAHGGAGLISFTSRQIQWKLWRAGKIDLEPGARTGSACNVFIRLQSGKKILRRFLKSEDFEDVYAFVECYELIEDGSPFPIVGEPVGYIHKYNFRLRDTNTSTPRGAFDLRDCRVGYIVERYGGFDADANLEVVDLQDGEPPQTIQTTTEGRSPSPLNEQLPLVASTPSMPGETRALDSRNYGFAIAQSPAASSTSTSSAKTHDRLDPSTIEAIFPGPLTGIVIEKSEFTLLSGKRPPPPIGTVVLLLAQVPRMPTITEDRCLLLRRECFHRKIQFVHISLWICEF
jgi:hypothetical protein